MNAHRVVCSSLDSHLYGQFAGYFFLFSLPFVGTRTHTAHVDETGSSWRLVSNVGFFLGRGELSK